MLIMFFSADVHLIGTTQILDISYQFQSLKCSTIKQPLKYYCCKCSDTTNTTSHAGNTTAGIAAVELGQLCTYHYNYVHIYSYIRLFKICYSSSLGYLKVRYIKIH